MNERVILPNYTEVRYCGTKCYIVGNDSDNCKEDLSNLNYYIKFANSKDDLFRKLENSGCWYDEMVLWSDIKEPSFVPVEELPIEILIAEVERRKKLIIPELIDSINENIKELKRYGVNIMDSKDYDFTLLEIVPVDDGVHDFETYYEEV